MSIIDGFRDLKNRGLVALTKKIVNSIIKEFGELVNFNIDSKNKNIELEISLKGEDKNIFLTIEKYEVVSEGASSCIKFGNVSASREWIEVIIKNFVIPQVASNKVIKIDSKYAMLINLLI